MGGPIIRVGSTPEFSKAWDKIFGDKKEAPPQEAAHTTEAAQTEQQEKTTEEKSQS